MYTRYTLKVGRAPLSRQPKSSTALSPLELVDSTNPDEPSRKPLYTVPTIKEYFQDLDEVLAVISDGPAKSFAFRRLRYLESKWNLYVLLNEYRELAEMKRVSHRDFYNVRKVRLAPVLTARWAQITGSQSSFFVTQVDTHIHHSASMNQKHMLRFIKSKMKRCPDVRRVRAMYAGLPA